LTAHPRTPWRLRFQEERGSSLIELMTATFILAVGMLALAAAMGLGFKSVALGRQRQTATEVGNARIEHLRNLSYTSVALSTQPVHSADPENPDYNVNADGVHFDYTGDTDCSTHTAACEHLIVDTTTGGVLHLEDPVQVGTTTMQVFQYATWVDDPDVAGPENYRRLTVVVKYNPAAVGGVTKYVRVSSLFTTDTVSVGGTAQGASQGTAGAPGAPPAAPPGGTCTGDTSGPTGSFEIASGTGSQTGYAATTTVTLSMSLTDACTPITVRFSNDGVVYGDAITYNTDNPSVSWTLTNGDGTKTVRARAFDGLLNMRQLDAQTVVLDTVNPSTPTSVGRSISCSGTDRTVTLSWGSSSDTNLLGYRVYRSVNNGEWTAIATVATLSHADTHSKTLDSVRFRVVAYDKAGNESAPTSEVTLAKNQCS
jgi:Tfp pilus assembly protein PilV